MTVLALLRERPRKVYELAAAVGRAPAYVESLLRGLERQGLAARSEGSDHVVTWVATVGPDPLDGLRNVGGPR